MNKLKDKLEGKNYEYVLFDYFDTIVHRRVSVNDLRKLWAKKIRRKLNLNITPAKLFEIRLSAEIHAERSSAFDGEYSYREVCDEVYTRLKPYSNEISSYSLDEFYDILSKEEISLELEYQSVDKEIFEVINELKNQKVKLILVSDFYFDSTVIKGWLTRHGLGDAFENYFISCECKLNKRKGKIYKYLLDTLNIKRPSKVIMIGDNKNSDYLNARKNGLDAIHLTVEYTPSLINKPQIQKKLDLISKKNRKDKGLEYGNYAFLLYRFTENLFNELTKNGFDSIYFLAREGEFLKRLFEIYLKKANRNDIATRYIYTSRLASYVPTLKDIEREDFERLLSQYPNINLKSFLKSIGFDDEAVVKVEKEFDESQLQIPVKDGLIEKLKKLPVFIDVYENLVAEQKELFLKYLEQLGISSNSKKVALCDVGWKGSIQDNLSNLYNSKIKLTGYYIGLIDCSSSEDNQKFGLAFSKHPSKSLNYDTWALDYNFLEKVLFASHPSTDGYKLENGEVVPKLKSFESEKFLFERISPVQERIAQTFDKICDLLNSGIYLSTDFEEFFCKTNLKTVLCVSRPSLKLQREMLCGQFENFGYNVSYKEHLGAQFTFKNILKKLRRSFKRVFSLLIIGRVLLMKKAYFLASTLYKVGYIFKKGKIKKS